MTDDLLYFDCESTGVDPITDRVTEVSVVRADGTVVFYSLVHPGRPIPPEVQALTGITDEMVTAAPPFADIAHQLADVLRDKPLAGFGCTEFDVPLLAEEFERAGASYQFGPVLDVGHLYKVLRPRTLAAAYAEFGPTLAPGVHRATHRATADALAVADVLGGMLRHTRVPPRATFDAIRDLSRGDRPERADPAGRLLMVNGVVCFGTHRNKGVPVADDLGYAEWMLKQGFPLSTQRVLREELDRIERERAAAAEARLEAALAGEVAATAGEIPF